MNLITELKSWRAGVTPTNSETLPTLLDQLVDIQKRNGFLLATRNELNSVISTNQLLHYVDDMLIKIYKMTLPVSQPESLLYTRLSTEDQSVSSLPDLIKRQLLIELDYTGFLSLASTDTSWNQYVSSLDYTFWKERTKKDLNLELTQEMYQKYVVNGVFDYSKLLQAQFEYFTSYGKWFGFVNNKVLHVWEENNENPMLLLEGNYFGVSGNQTLKYGPNPNLYEDSVIFILIGYRQSIPIRIYFDPNDHQYYIRHIYDDQHKTYNYQVTKIRTFGNTQLNIATPLIQLDTLHFDNVTNQNLLYELGTVTVNFNMLFVLDSENNIRSENIHLGIDEFRAYMISVGNSPSYFDNIIGKAISFDAALMGKLFVVTMEGEIKLYIPGGVPGIFVLHPNFIIEPIEGKKFVDVYVSKRYSAVTALAVGVFDDGTAVILSINLDGPEPYYTPIRFVDPQTVNNRRLNKILPGITTVQAILDTNDIVHWR